MIPLSDNQLSGVSKLSRLKVGALFMEPGTGKTRTAASLIPNETDFVMWLTPCRTIDNLKAELANIGTERVHVAGIESISQSDRIFLQLTRLLQSAQAPTLIVDESLKIKNWTAVRTKRIIELGRLATYKLILNGTPLSRNILDLWAQMEFLSPRILNMDQAEFKNTFCEWTKVTKRIGNTVRTKEWITKHHNVDYLYSIIAPYIYECELALEVQKQHITIEYDLCTESAQQYGIIKEKLLNNEMLQWKNNNIFLELTQKLQHIYSATEQKFQAVEAILNSNDRTKVVVFCKFKSSEAKLKGRFPGLTVLTYGKHSFGLNLQQYNVLVFFDKTWDYAQRLQTERRIWREGQTNNCLYYDLTGRVGLDRLIDANVHKKQSLLQYFKAVGVEQIAKQL